METIEDLHGQTIVNHGQLISEASGRPWFPVQHKIVRRPTYD
jgi:hypothetical protein